MDSFMEEVKKEAHRVEEDALFSAKSHYNAAARWDHYHTFLGIMTAIFAAASSGVSFSEIFPDKGPVVSGILAVISTSLAATLTLLKPSERAESHKSAADQYLSLKNQARFFRSVEADTLSLSGKDEVIKRLRELTQMRDQLNKAALPIPEKDYQKAKKGIESGQSQYEADSL